VEILGKYENLFRAGKNLRRRRGREEKREGKGWREGKQKGMKKASRKRRGNEKWTGEYAAR